MKKRNSLIIDIVIACLIILIIVLISVDRKSNETIKYGNYKFSIENFFYHENEISDIIKPHQSFEVKDDGYDIYVPNRSGYRYGPSIMYYQDGSMDAWFAANGNNSSEWDWITYRHFNGEEWSDEQVVLRPTKESRDHYSTCDPGVIYFDGYYYLGYTSTENARNGGIENNIFVARSKTPDGPFEKWNGKEWGGDPEPIIEYTLNDGGWGAGEISFVIVNDKLWCYYSYIDGQDRSYENLIVAPLQEDWPGQLKEVGTVINKVRGQGSMDFVYNEFYERMLGFCVEDSFGKDSCIAVYESEDGVNFKQIDTVEDSIDEFCHNMGISKMPDGHIDYNDDLYIGYAHSKGSYNIWGRWSTKIRPIEFKTIK